METNSQLNQPEISVSGVFMTWFHKRKKNSSIIYLKIIKNRC